MQYLDPSLFQNVILGILTIFISFAIILLTDIFKSKEGKGAFEKRVVQEEVLEIKPITLLTIITLLALALLPIIKWPITKTPTILIVILASVLTLVATLCLIIFICQFSKIFKNILRFYNDPSKFEVSFLEKLRFSKTSESKNKENSEKMVDAWGALWSEKSRYKEDVFTEIFISHIDDAIKHGQLNLVDDLSQTYMDNIGKRSHHLICWEILPKVLEWGEKLETERSNYDVRNFFEEVIQVLLKNSNDPHSFFRIFKQYVGKSLKKVNEMQDEEEQNRAWEYIHDLFRVFCPKFFNVAGDEPNGQVWANSLPKEWRTSMANKGNPIASVIFEEFIVWAQNRIYKYNPADNDDLGLSRIVRSIFPDVHHQLFREFLMLYFSLEIEHALKRRPNYRVLSSVFLRSRYDPNATEEDLDKAFSQEKEQQVKAQKIETVQIILRIFLSSWVTSPHYGSATKVEAENWENHPEERQSIAYRIWLRKLEKMQNEAKNDETIKKMCREDELKEYRRQDILELLKLLIKEIKKKYGKPPQAP